MSQWYELVIFTASMEVSRFHIVCVCVCQFMQNFTFFSVYPQMYGMAVANKLENNKNIFQRRYFRQVRITKLFQLCSCRIIMYHLQHCTMDFNGYTKDLSSVCQDLSSIFIVDNSPAAYRGNPGALNHHSVC